MEPESNLGATGAALSATQTATPSTETQQPSSVSPPAAAAEPKTPDPGHASGADFDHPEFGAKLRNMQKGMEESARKSKEWEEKYAAYANQVADLNTRLSAKPELLNQVRALYGMPPLEGAKTEELDEPGKLLKEEVGRIEALRQADQAIFEKQLELGGGDLAKGRALYETYSQPALEIMKAFRDGDPRTQLSMAIEYHLLKQRIAQANQRQAANGAVIPSTETGRAAPSNPAGGDDGPMTPEKALRMAGYTPASFAEANHAFD